MVISINKISSGMGLLVENEIYVVIEYSHVKPGKGAAFVRVRLKKLKTDLVIERTFRTADKLEDIYLENRAAQFLYRSSSSFHFMDQTTYEEFTLNESQIGKGVKYLKDNLEVTAIFYDHQLQKVILPNFITFNVMETEPGIRGDSSRLGTKPAKIDTGAVVQVPLFVNAGDVIKIDTRSDDYIERVQQ